MENSKSLSSGMESLHRVYQFRAATMEELLGFALEEALKLSGSKIGYIYHYDEDGSTFTLDAYSTGVMDECNVPDMPKNYQLEQTGVWGNAVRDRAPIIINDFQAPDPRKKGYPLGHAPLRRFMTVPVTDGEKILGVAGVANKESPYDENDVLELTLLMDAIWKLGESLKTQEELRAARDAAEAANREKGNFLATISHEIRTPLNAIAGMTHLALQTELDARQRDYLTKIGSATELLTGIINDVLDFSRMEAGKLDLEQLEFDLHALLQSLTSLVELACRDKGLEVVFRIAPLVPRFLIGSRLRLGQILGNLLSNAVKFTECGEIILSVEREAKNDNSVILNFSVTDSGIGISALEMERLFKPFSQADSSITRRFGGTGLGLSIVKRLCELMGGTVSVLSDKGRGSRFSVSIPFGIPLSKEPPLGIETSGIRILLADDSMAARSALTEMLEDHGFRVEAVNSGEEALAAVERSSRRAMISNQAQEEREPFRLVILDWWMPRMDGLETARRITAMEGSKPLIILTASQGREDLFSRTASEGIDAFLPKPILPSALLETIFRVLGQPSTPARHALRHDAILSKLRNFHGARVLSVEDNRINQQIIQEILERSGLSVESVDNGQAALDALKSGRVFDLILMDIQMPDMDGYETTRLIREDPRGIEIPIIAMTAHVLRHEREHCLNAGMNDHVGKPVDPDKLCAVVLRWLESHGSAQKFTRSTSPPLQISEERNISLPDSLPGFSLEATLSRVMGNGELLARLIEDFARHEAGFMETLEADLCRGDRTTALNRLHALKGVAANLGAEGLCAAAKEAEVMLKRSTDLNVAQSDDVLITLKAELATVDRAAAILRSHTNTNLGNWGGQSSRDSIIGRSRILIVDDEPVNLQILAEILGRGYELATAMNGEEAIGLARAIKPDLVLMDVMMPGMNGYETCRRIHAEEDMRDLPVIFVTALAGAEDESAGLALGALDYITKPFSPNIVRLRVKNQLEIKRARDILEKFSFQDSLTSLDNRRSLDRHLEREWLMARRRGTELSLIMIDIDFFKQFNDDYGHPAGDACLRSVASALVSAVRGGDLVTRYGGEEFCCILSETGAEEGKRIGQRLLDKVAALCIPHKSSNVLSRVSISLGLATGEPARLSSSREILKAADGALYEAKAAGRNQMKSVSVRSASEPQG